MQVPNFACPGQVLVYSSQLVGRQFAQAFAHWVSENEHLIALQENLLVLDNWMVLRSKNV